MSSVPARVGRQHLGFGEDEGGELYATALNGTVYRFMSREPAFGLRRRRRGGGGRRRDHERGLHGLLELLGGAQTVTVQYATGGRHGRRRGSDYRAGDAAPSLPARRTVTRTVSVPVLGDVLDEDDETFMVTCRTPLNAHLGDGQGAGTIPDDDPLPFALRGRLRRRSRATPGLLPATSRVPLAPVSGRTVTVAFATADGTATAGSDYIAADGGAHLRAGRPRQRWR